MPTIRFETPDDETLDIFIDDKSIGHFDHDFDGWSGMQQAQQMARRVAEVMGWKVEEAE